MRTLLIEDEPDLAELIRRGISASGFAVDVALDGESGLFKARGSEYDVIVLDLMLPRLSGGDLLQLLRQTKKTPVLVLTARDEVADRVDILNLGADDYLTKPFDMDELIARVRALIRRSTGNPSPLLEFGDLVIDTVAREVAVRGQRVALTAKEYAILELLAMNRGKLVTRTMIYDKVYGDQDDTLSNIVDVYISTLRKKLGVESLIETRRGEGYIIRD
jgi:two-component system OmpR family response regulator